MAGTRSRWLAAGLAALVALAVAGAFWSSGRSRAPRAAGPDSPREAAAGDADPALLPASGVAPAPDRAAEAPAVPRAALEVARVHGRVVEEGTRAGVEDLVVELARDDEVLASTRSDAAGVFGFPPPPGEAACVLRLALPDELEAVIGEVEVLPGRLAEEYVLCVRRLPAAPVSGRAVDARTGEPVPFLGIVIDENEGFQMGALGGDVEELETDAAGRFRSRRSYLRTRLAVRPAAWEKGALVSTSFNSWRLDHDPERPDAGDVPITVGPTYRLDLELPPDLGVEDLEAELDSDSTDASPFTSPPREARLRAGDLPWVRFPHSDVFQDPPPPWKLTVRTPDGEWNGSARVDSVVGVHPRPVSIRLARGGGLRGDFVSRDGDPGPVYVELRVPGGETDGRGFFLDSYQVTSLEPGTYYLAAESRTHVAPEELVTVAAGPPTERDVELVRRESVGGVSGVIRSESGRAYPELDVRLFEEGRRQFNWKARIAWEEGADHGTFAFEDLPAGRYVVHAYHHLGRVEPVDAVVSPPDDSLELLIRDEPGSFTKYAIEAVDAETGERIRGPRLMVRSSPHDDPIRQWTSGSTLVLNEGLPGTHREWQVACDGYERAWGDESSFVAEPDEENVRHLTVELRRGWSGRVLVCTVAGEPLAGVEIAFDGAPPATTDGDGRVVVSAAKRPQRVDVQREGWHVAGGDLDQATGAFTDAGFEIVVELAAD